MQMFVLCYLHVVHYMAVSLLFGVVSALRMPTILVYWCIQHAERLRVAGHSTVKASSSNIEGEGEGPRMPIRRLEPREAEGERAYSGVVTIIWYWLLRALWTSCNCTKCKQVKPSKTKISCSRLALGL